MFTLAREVKSSTYLAPSPIVVSSVRRASRFEWSCRSGLQAAPTLHTAHWSLTGQYGRPANGSSTPAKQAYPWRRGRFLQTFDQTVSFNGIAVTNVYIIHSPEIVILTKMVTQRQRFPGANSIISYIAQLSFYLELLHPVTSSTSFITK